MIHFIFSEDQPVITNYLCYLHLRHGGKVQRKYCSDVFHFIISKWYCPLTNLTGLILVGICSQLASGWPLIVNNQAGINNFFTAQENEPNCDRWGSLTCQTGSWLRRNSPGSTWTLFCLLTSVWLCICEARRSFPCDSNSSQEAWKQVNR